MDSLTHLVAGALTPLAFRDTPKRAAILGFGIAAGELPDIDVVFGTGWEALLVLHRGITHSLFLQPVFVLLLVIPAWLWLGRDRKKPVLKSGGFPARTGSPDTLTASVDQALPARVEQAASEDHPGGTPASRAGNAPGGCYASTALPKIPGARFSRLYLIALICVYTHIYLDCMTTFGTMILMPFSDLRIAFPALFIIDPFLTLPASAFLLLALRHRAVPAVALPPVRAIGPASCRSTGPSAATPPVADPVGMADAAPVADPANIPSQSPAGWLVFSTRARALARIGLAWVLMYPLICLALNAITATSLVACQDGVEPVQRAAPHQVQANPAQANSTRMADADPVQSEAAGAEAIQAGAGPLPGPGTLRWAGPGGLIRASADQGTRPGMILLTEPFSPLVWKAVFDEGETYRMQLARLGGTLSSTVERFNKADPGLYASLAGQEPLFALFARFAPIMVQTSRPVSPEVQAGYAETVTEHAFMDLRYVMAEESVSRRFGRADPVFVLEARVNAAGILLAYRFLERGRDATRLVWTQKE